MSTGIQQLSRATSAAPVVAPAAARSRKVRIATLLVYTVLWAVLCDLILEYSTWLATGNSWIGPLANLANYAVGVLFLWTCILWLLAATARLWVAFSVSFAISVVLAVVNFYKLDVLTEPVVPLDVLFVSQPQALMTTRGWWTLSILGLALGAVALLIRRTTRHFAKRRPVSGRDLLPPRVSTVGRVMVVLVVGALLATSVTFGRSISPWRALYDGAGAKWVGWDPALNYGVNGFVGGFLYSMPAEAMTEPDGYSADAVRTVAARYASEQGGAAAPSPLPNIVVVLSEGFSDPETVNGFTLDEDVIPNVRTLMSRAWSGSIITNQYGHGTSSVEFEVLTGQALSLLEPQMMTPYQTVVPARRSYPSVVGWANSRGYRTTAIHSFAPDMYRRTSVYRTLGFDEFRYDDTMHHQDRIEANPYISDASAFEEVVDEVRSSADPAFVHLVTMQNHYPTTGHYADPPEVAGAGETTNEALAGYGRGLSYTDRALRDMLSELSGLDEETMLVFFGDHHPPVYDDAIRAANDELTLLETPFLIWSSDDVAGRGRDLGVVSPTRLMPLLFDRAGIPLPGYYTLLDRVGTEVGALHHASVISPDGESRPQNSLPGEQADLLRDLRLIQYDLVEGEQFERELLWY